MKKIIYTAWNDLKGKEVVFVVTPQETTRRAYSVTLLASGRKASSESGVPLEELVRKLDLTNPEMASVEWAETEDEFVNRILGKDVPAGARNVQVVDESAIPNNRSNRDNWQILNGSLSA